MSDPTYSSTYAGPEDKTMIAVVYVLYLLGFVSGGATTLIGLIMAYVLKGGAGAVALSHYTLLIRTFWGLITWMVIAGVTFAVGMVLSIVLIGIPLLVLASILFTVALVWYGVRCIIGLIAALHDQPYGRPRAWVF